MQLEAREKLVIYGEMSILENVLKVALNLNRSNPTDFFRLISEYKILNPVITSIQKKVLAELEHEYTGREKLIIVLDDILSGTITRTAIKEIIDSLKTEHTFSKFISNSKHELVKDSRRLSNATHAGESFDDIYPNNNSKNSIYSRLREYIKNFNDWYTFIIALLAIGGYYNILK